MKNRAFTLIELLVVVLIIGILAAIALPQYQKAVLKSNLHKGISLVESLYQSQQAYYLAHGKFAQELNDLDVSAPLHNNCTKKNISNASQYTCDFGELSINRGYYAITYAEPSGRLVYSHHFVDQPLGNVTLKKDKRYCWAKLNDSDANSVCQSIGGTLIGSAYWDYYEL